MYYELTDFSLNTSGCVAWTQRRLLLKSSRLLVVGPNVTSHCTSCIRVRKSNLFFLRTNNLVAICKTKEQNQQH